MIARLDRMLGATMGAMQWLALPLVLLLFLQWPLRDLVQAYSAPRDRVLADVSALLRQLADRRLLEL